ncbi:rRNA maturation RNase YbeY [Niabella hirudinis]|uniref:rRNA maturation RNase YbeY n=1 Tax=Niabella hirudinis TaxID=1285929 RepID=UPI003EBD5DC2
MTVNQSPSVGFSFHKAVVLKDRKRLKSFLTGLFRDNKQELERLHYVFCSDEEIIRINRQYLEHDYYTDIITFDLREKATDAMNADIFVSVDTVRSNAHGLGERFYKELHRVIFHGALHLCGYNDKNSREQRIMRKMEDQCLLEYGF